MPYIYNVKRRETGSCNFFCPSSRPMKWKKSYGMSWQVIEYLLMTRIFTLTWCFKNFTLFSRNFFFFFFLNTFYYCTFSFSNECGRGEGDILVYCRANWKFTQALVILTLDHPHRDDMKTLFTIIIIINQLKEESIWWVKTLLDLFIYASIFVSHYEVQTRSSLPAFVRVPFRKFMSNEILLHASHICMVTLGVNNVNKCCANDLLFFGSKNTKNNPNIPSFLT